MAGQRALRRVEPGRRSPLGAAVAMALPMALVPVVILLANGLRVRQCDVWGGLGFLFIGPVFSTLWAASLGAVIGLAEPRKLRASLWFYAIFLLWAAADALHILREPAIFAYNPFAGFFSGAIYDTVIRIDQRIMVYRLNNMVQLGFIIALARLAWDRDRQRLTWRALGAASTARWVAVVALGAVAGAFWLARAEVGYEVGRAAIQATLGGRVSDERLTIWYDRERWSVEQASEMLEDHRFRLEQLEVELGVRFPRRMTSYVFGSSEEKRRLMGAGQVYIAKPWLDEIYMNPVAYGDSVVKHELAHVVLGVWTDSPLKLPTSDGCWIPPMALVEGAAAAFQWDSGAMTPHTWSAAMRRAKVAPDLRKVLGSDGFYDQAANVAYTMMGSFVRWFQGVFGQAALAKAYRDGRFPEASGVGLDELVTRWEGMVDGLAVPADTEALATARFSGKAIHRRPCGLDVARVEADAAERMRARDVKGAEALYRQVVAWIPEDAQKRLPLVTLAAQRGDLARVRAAWAAYEDTPGNRNAVSDAAAKEVVADAIARVAFQAAGGVDERLLDEAAGIYREVAQAVQSEGRQRNVLVKVMVAGEPRYRSKLWKYLITGSKDELKMAERLWPDDALVAYLVGRREAGAGNAARALEQLGRAVARWEAEERLGAAAVRGAEASAARWAEERLGAAGVRGSEAAREAEEHGVWGVMGWGVVGGWEGRGDGGRQVGGREAPAWLQAVHREAVRLQAEELWKLGEWAEAERMYRKVAGLTPYEGDRERYLDWASRCVWKQGGGIRLPGR